ncbi:hypothetical protein Ato02nite_055180 [Paractinoplanes toevensis]|uniref:Uncharacterized protein n=1 Tax=Paractinoplanes toevensis TaxID=571911 RepID=A0A919W5Y6_9ACTN|nr:hypothetical protein Ato02nite_055180 [Actinoplanes toevensis]
MRRERRERLFQHPSLVPPPVRALSPRWFQAGVRALGSNRLRGGFGALGPKWFGVGVLGLGWVRGGVGVLGLGWVRGGVGVLGPGRIRGGFGALGWWGSLRWRHRCDRKPCPAGGLGCRGQPGSGPNPLMS